MRASDLSTIIDSPGTWRHPARTFHHICWYFDITCWHYMSYCSGCDLCCCRQFMMNKQFIIIFRWWNFNHRIPCWIHRTNRTVCGCVLYSAATILFLIIWRYLWWILADLLAIHPTMTTDSPTSTSHTHLSCSAVGWSFAAATSYSFLNPQYQTNQSEDINNNAAEFKIRW